MTGETFHAHAQPGGRAPAPGPLALVQAFLNTHYDLGVEHGAEVWTSPDALRRWLEERDLLAPGAAVDGNDLRRALAVRGALREFARGRKAALIALSAAADGAPVELRFTEAGPAFATTGSAASAIGVVLALAAWAMIDGSWARLKICPGRHCDWAFFDHSRNGSGRWCSMSICGGREKARAHYRRTRGGG